MRVMLVNDTANEPHIGCQAVSDAHARLLGAAGHRVVERFFLRELQHFGTVEEASAANRILADEAMVECLDRVDAVVVNGEGTLHHGRGTEYYALLAAAQQLGKATLIVNSVFEANAGWAKVLERLDDFCVRDARSLAAARAAGVRCRLVPDSVLAAGFETDGGFVDLDGRIVVTDWHPDRDNDVGTTLRRIIDAVDDAFFFPLEHGAHAYLWRHTVACWQACACVVTARHHGVYLAALAGRPFVALPSNTTKIEGLLEAAGVELPLCTTAEQVVEALAFAQHHLDRYERLRTYLCEAMPLSTFAALGRGSDDTSPDVEVERLAQQLCGRSISTAPRFWNFWGRA
jgi:polysaccharide pyruvyl transferase WcaK-like protein